MEAERRVGWGPGEDPPGVVHKSEHPWLKGRVEYVEIINPRPNRRFLMVALDTDGCRVGSAWGPTLRETLENLRDAVECRRPNKLVKRWPSYCC